MNWPLEIFKGKDVVFVGVGQGRSLAGFKEFIEKHGEIKSFTGVDKLDSNDPLGFLKTYDQDQTLFVKNEGIPPQEMPVAYITPMNVFFDCVEQLGAVTIGITGTKGKSTTTALTAAMIAASGKQVILGGNIGEFGESLFGSLDNATKETVFVIELSSYQLADITHSPHIAACINLYHDHVDWHGSLHEYWEAKHHIIAHSQPNDLFVYNPAFPAIKEWAEDAQCRTIAINPEEPFNMTLAALYGDHNRMNALVARSIAREVGVSDVICQQALNSFKPLPHRMELVPTQTDRIFIDDAIGMTPESTTASLIAVAKKYGSVGCILLGGQDREYNFQGLMRIISEHKVPALVLFPDTVDMMKAALPSGYTPLIHETRDMQDAVTWAYNNTPASSVILLSTAAPSYSLWSGFIEKGDQFKAAATSFTK